MVQQGIERARALSLTSRLGALSEHQTKWRRALQGTAHKSADARPPGIIGTSDQQREAHTPFLSRSVR